MRISKYIICLMVYTIRHLIYLLNLSMVFSHLSMRIVFFINHGDLQADLKGESGGAEPLVTKMQKSLTAAGSHPPCA